MNCRCMKERARRCRHKLRDVDIDAKVNAILAFQSDKAASLAHLDDPNFLQRMDADERTSGDPDGCA